MEKSPDEKSDHNVNRSTQGDSLSAIFLSPSSSFAAREHKRDGRRGRVKNEMDVDLSVKSWTGRMFPPLMEKEETI